jgi:very-short-patch-repair endonuclease
MPYAVGQFRDDWQRYPVLVRQFHPDLNNGITLTQVPPAADVYLLWQCEIGHRFVATPWEQRQKPGRSRRRSTWCPECAVGAGGGSGTRKKPSLVCDRTPEVPPGEVFVSECAPKPASAAEAFLRQALAARLEFEPGFTAVRVRQPFFNHLEVWPDIILPNLRVAIEYDSIGRDGLEHVGQREKIDPRKDALLRATGWEVIRVRTGKLLPMGPHDIVAPEISGRAPRRLIDRILDELRAIRGDLIVNCYLRD